MTIRRHAPVVVDALGGALVVLVLWVTVPVADDRARFIQLALGAVAVAGAALRHRAPRTAVVLTACATGVAWSLGLTADPLLLVGLALRSVARARGRRALPAASLAGVAVAVSVLAVIAVPGHEDGVRSAALAGVVVLAAWASGVSARTRERVAAENAMLRERARMTRDVHDVLSHALGSIGVEAGTAAHVRTLREEDLRGTLVDIAATARGAVAELGAVLADLRAGDRGGAPADVPLEALLRETAAVAERAGMRVRLRVDDVHDVPDPVRATLHRIAREAVTNAVRHSGGSRCDVDVVVHADPPEVRLTVADDGRGPGPDDVEGDGLLGIRERVALSGGTLEVGRGPAGGTELRAVVPLAPSGSGART
ncbi:sensor histidine kinase [Clavibacter michiganensis]|uniref:sensor histidine kinase n=1 Tax=Clavibacter michiganensis TaxID=28447 RepID=UPI000691E3BC|nr:ATP-binding protein [Clavibacter michiganensis]